MEFGLMPIACSHIILLMMTGFKIINVHDTPHNHALLNGVQKCRLYINNVAVFLFVSLCFVWVFFNFVIFQNFVCCVFGFFFGFVWEKILNQLTDLFNNWIFLFDSACSVDDSGTVCSVYNDRDVRWTRTNWGHSLPPH